MSKKKKERPLPESLGLPPIGVDTHAHVDLEHFAGEVDEVLERAARAGVARVGNVFLGVEAYRANAPLFERHGNVFFILGVHPHDASGVTEESLEAMRRAYGEDGRIKALGEMGLDFHYDRSPRDAQERVFRDQLALARDLDAPVVIHSREAEEKTVAILLDMGFKDRALMWHCFGGGPEFAERVLGNGWFVSVPGTVSYSKNGEAREAMKVVPLERMVLETDCPYLAPDPYRGKRNEPALLGFTALAVAEAKGIGMEEVWAETATTARRFFSL